MDNQSQGNITPSPPPRIISVDSIVPPTPKPFINPLPTNNQEDQSVKVNTFVGGKSVATVLGILLLIVGLGAGTMLVKGPQLLNQNAAEVLYACNSGLYCSGNQIAGGSRCLGGANYTDPIYCCPANYNIFNNTCTPICGSDLYCSIAPVQGGSLCLGGQTYTTPEYCCPQNYKNINGVCMASPVNCTSDTQCGAGVNSFKCNLGTHSCEDLIGVGNCANNTGNCYVKTAIGIEDTPGDDGIRNVCEAGGHWTTCAPGYTCSNYDCIPNK